MRDLLRNQSLVYYKTVTGKEEIIDEDGNHTGLYDPIYSELKAMMISVSANKGTTEAEAFGTNLDYDKTLSTSNINCELDENTILWIDADPTSDINPDPYNFIVRRKAKSINQVLYAIKQVDVSNGA